MKDKKEKEENENSKLINPGIENLKEKNNILFTQFLKERNLESFSNMSKKQRDELEQYLEDYVNNNEDIRPRTDFKKLKRLDEEIKESITDFIRNGGRKTRCKLYYLHSARHMQMEEISLPDFQPVIQLELTGEVFYLREPAFYLDHMAIFIVESNFPISLSFEMNLDKHELVEVGYSPTDIDAKVDSTYTRLTWQGKKISFKGYLFIIISYILVVVMTVMACHIYYTSLFGIPGVEE